MTELKYKGKSLDFFKLISEQKIEIPIIQRDYAQGRKDKREIRINFLNALFESISYNKPIKLDFIYGSNVNNSFQPLDGQQRLTTLFLLHWYAAIQSNSLDENTQKLLSKFSYETRITSRDFCLALVQNPISITSKDESISSKVIDSNWFFLSWKNDPTIDSMLRTIDDIHSIFFEVESLWEKLASSKNLISFYYVELENIGLTDDLYIKMNARGKLLTSFENFKASFQKYITDAKWEIGKQFTDCFPFKIDTQWTDFFWQHFRKNNSIDDSFMRFIATIAMIRIAIEGTSGKEEEKIQSIRKLQDEPNIIRPEQFSITAFNSLIESFEIFENALKRNINLTLPFPLWRHSHKNSILSEIVFEDNSFSPNINSASYTQKVLFFAQTEYLRNISKFNQALYQDWMRVIRNIVSRGALDKDGNRPDVIRSPETFNGVINLINELSEGCKDIYKYLSELDSLKSQFAKDQIEEEKNKAKLIITKPHLKQLIFDAEDNSLLNGKIEFIFYCMNYNNDVNSFDEKLFNDLINVFKKYFNTETISNDLRRAFLTISVNNKYEFYNYWWSYWNIIGAVKRRLFDRFRELEYYLYCNERDYFKNLVLQLIHKDLKAIATDFSPPRKFPNWKLRLIKETNLLDEAKSKYIAILEDDSKCYLLKSKRPRDTEGSTEVE